MEHTLEQMSSIRDWLSWGNNSPPRATRRRGPVSAGFGVMTFEPEAYLYPCHLPLRLLVIWRHLKNCQYEFMNFMHQYRGTHVYTDDDRARRVYAYEYWLE